MYDVSELDQGPNKRFLWLAGVSAWTIPKLFRFWHFARVELRPPRLREMGEVSQGFSNLKAGFRTGAWKNVTVSVSAFQVPERAVSLLKSKCSFFTIARVDVLGTQHSVCCDAGNMTETLLLSGSYCEHVRDHGIAHVVLRGRVYRKGNGHRVPVPWSCAHGARVLGQRWGKLGWTHADRLRQS